MSEVTAFRKMQRDPKISMGLSILLGLQQADIGRIVFRCRRQVGRPMSEIDLGLGEPDKLHSLSHGIGHQQPHGIGVADILRSKNDHTPSDEFRVLPSLQHPRKPIERPIRIESRRLLM